MDFSVDCGEVLRGHALRFTGLRRDGVSDDARHSEYTEHHPGKPVHPVVSLTYELTPGLLTDTTPDGREIDVSIQLTPPADPAHWPAVLRAGAERDVADGGPVTHGAFGPFVVPDDTRAITFDLSHFGVTRDGTPPLDDGPEVALGVLEVDLVTQRAVWRRR